MSSIANALLLVMAKRDGVRDEILSKCKELENNLLDSTNYKILEVEIKEARKKLKIHEDFIEVLEGLRK